MTDRAFLKQMGGYGLLTAEIHYYMPDYPALLQQFVWQQYDVAPQFPELHRFLDFWRRELEGALHEVRVMTGGRGRLRHADWVAAVH